MPTVQHPGNVLKQECSLSLPQAEGEQLLREEQAQQLQDMS